MVQVERHEHALELGQEPAGGNRGFTEGLEREATHLHDVRELLHEVGAVVPDGGVLMSRPDEGVVDVVHEAEAVAEALFDDGLERGLLVRARRKLAVQPANRQLVVHADASGVGVGEVERSSGDLHEGRGVVHDGGAAPVGARDVVVREAERVTHLVRRELTHARERHLHGVRARGVGEIAEAGPRREATRRRRRRVRRNDASPDQDVLTQAQAAEVDVALQDLAGAGVHHRVAVGPPAGGAVGPVDDVVTKIHRIGALGQQLDAEGVDETRGLEGLVPPRRPFQKRRSNGLGHSAVEGVDDGLARLRALGGRILLLQTVADGPLHLQGAVDRARVVGEGDAEGPDPRVHLPG